MKLSCLPVNRNILWGLIFCASLLTGYAQKQISTTAGTLISVGLQDEWAISVGAIFTPKEKVDFRAAYNLYFRRDVRNQNAENFHEVLATVQTKLIDLLGFEIDGGVGYVGNNFFINENARDTATFFVQSGDFNHGLVLNFTGVYQLSYRLSLYAEYNFKSFGKRFDTFGFGLRYTIPLI
ncbi:hypothetical protein GCM10009117_04280 [Gangjinia marincola]|uniref:Uncharacterized protein n=1 Tax=Gangjinia marincola TaxID=578463 RepID=A0ABP3XSQ0_9FLAO